MCLRGAGVEGLGDAAAERGRWAALLLRQRGRAACGGCGDAAHVAKVVRAVDREGLKEAEGGWAPVDWKARRVLHIRDEAAEREAHPEGGAEDGFDKNMQGHRAEWTGYAAACLGLTSTKSL